MVTLYWDIEKKYDQIVAELYNNYKEKLNRAQFPIDNDDICAMVKQYIIVAVEEKRNREEHGDAE